MLEAGHCIAIQCVARTQHGAGSAGRAQARGRGAGGRAGCTGERTGSRRAACAHLGMLLGCGLCTWCTQPIFDPV